MEVHSPVEYLHRSSMEQSYSLHDSYYSGRLSIDESEVILLHPLIIGKDIVVCMPEVNKVLRNVYQVLSQANYYLSKHGITSRRYTGAQLIRIKMLGILGHEAKVCSYILQRDAERIFDSFDVSGDSRKSSKIQWMDPVLLDEKPIPQSGGKSNSAVIKNEPRKDGPVKVHLFKLGEDIIVCAPEVQRVFQSNSHQGATVGYYFTKLGIVPYKFIHTSHLDKIKGLGIVKKCAVHCTYILKEDAIRVFEAYGMTKEQIKTQVEFLEIIVLDENPTQHSWKVKKERSNSDETISPRPGCISPSSSLSDCSGKLENEGEKDMKVHVFIVEGQEVVCMPDIHKIVQNIHGNSIQVNYYFNKLKVQKRRFCFAHLRELKSRKILQNNATYCTYVPRHDAEKLFQIYCFVDDPKLKGVEWIDPVVLDAKRSATPSPVSETGNKDLDGESEKEFVIHTFSLDNLIVITVPDVHRIVDFLDEQSASLDYHFRKLGIPKCRFTYAQLHQLRRLNVIKRPTVCTYISQDDVNRLLKMYETERNRNRMNNLKFLAPVQLARGTPLESNTRYNNKLTDRKSSPTSKSPQEGQFESQNSPYQPLSPGTECSPSFVMTSSTHSHDNNDLTGTHSAAISHIQNIHPSIDCPIVIPNGDYDPMKAKHEEEQSKSLKRHYEGYSPSAKRLKLKESSYECLIQDINRKEEELRVLYDGYQRELKEEKNKRRAAEQKLTELKEDQKREFEEEKSKRLAAEEKLAKFKDDLEEEKRRRLAVEQILAEYEGHHGQ